MTKSNKCSINPEGIDTLEGAKDPRTGQPPCGRQKRVGKAPATPVPFPLFWIRRRSLGRRLRAGSFIHGRGTLPMSTSQRAPRARALPLLRPLDTPARVTRLTADGHTPAEPLFCMSAATLHRWSSSARLPPEPETSHGWPGHGSHAPKCYVIRAACTTRCAVSVQHAELPSEPFSDFVRHKKAARRSGGSTPHRRLDHAQTQTARA